MRKCHNDDYEPACAICEHMSRIELTGDYICKLRRVIKQVQPDHSCRRFKLDLLTIAPPPRATFPLWLEDETSV